MSKIQLSPEYKELLEAIPADTRRKLSFHDVRQFIKHYQPQIKAQQERIEELECVSGLIEDAYDDLQDAYADISMDMSGDEKEVTAAKSRNQQVKFALKVCEILSPNARKARQALKEKADE